MTAVGNPETPRYAGVHVDHPRIVEYGKNLAKQGKSKEHAQRVLGMPREVVDRIYRDVEKEKNAR